MKKSACLRGVGLACLLALGGCDGTEPTTDTDAGSPVDGSTPARDGGSAEDGGSVATQDIVVTGMGSAAVPNGGRYEQLTLDGIPPYSDGVAELTITNRSGAPLTVHGLTLTPVGETEAIEWTVNEPGRTMRHPITVSEQTLAPDGGLVFGLDFYPLASGPRDVRVDIAYGDGETFSFTVAGRGRDNATFSPRVANVFEHLFGRSNIDNSNSFEVGGIGADASGNVFFNGNVSGWSDAFGLNITMVRVSADGELAWVRELQEPFPQESRDIGNNREIGGGPDSLDVDSDGDAYIAADRALASSGTGQCLVMQVDGDTGDLVWARGLNLDTGSEDAPIAARVLRCQTVDASIPDRVLVAGQVADSAGAFLFALSKTDGSLLWARTFSLGGVHRVGALVVDAANGRAYLGGIANAAPFTARFDDIATASPTLAWSRGYALGAANVHGLALDGDGLLAAIDVRGATTFFTGARISTADGSVVWSRTWDLDGGAKNRALAVVVHEGQAIFSGRIGFQPFDPGGDGFLLALDPATGAYEWGSFYYGGKGAEEIMNSNVTGMVSTPAGLWLLQYQTPGANNMAHFWGRWYEAIDDTLDFPGGDGSMRLGDAGFSAGGPGTTSLETPANARAHLASVLPTEWVDVTDSVEFEDPVVTEQESFRAGTQALLQRVTITP